MYLIVLQFSLIVPAGMFFAFNYKELAFYKNKYFLEHDHLITLIGSLGILANGLFRNMWGYLFDKFTYKKLMLCINIVLLLVTSLILLAVNSFFTFLLIIIFNYLAYGGTYALLPTQIVRIMGEKAAVRIFWLAFSAFSIASTLQFLIHYFLITNFGE